MKRVLKTYASTLLILLGFSWAAPVHGANDATFLLFQSPEDTTLYEIQLHEDTRPTRQRNIRIHNGDSLRISLNPCLEGDLDDQVIRFEREGTNRNFHVFLRPPPSCRARPHMIYSIYLKRGDRDEEKIADVEFLTLRAQKVFTLHSNHDPEVSYYNNGNKEVLRRRNTLTHTDMSIRFEKDNRARFAGSLDANLQLAANPSGTDERPEIGEDFPGGGPLVVDTPPEEADEEKTDILNPLGSSEGNAVEAQTSRADETSAGHCGLVRSPSPSSNGTLLLGLLFLFTGFLAFRKNLTS